MVDKRLVMFAISMVIVLFAVTLVSGFFHKDDPKKSPFEASVTISNVAPEIIQVSNVNEQNSELTTGIIDPLAGCGLAGAAACPTAYVTFVARDPNGEGTLNDASAAMTFTSPGPRLLVPVNLVCVPEAALDPGLNPVTDQNYSCTVAMLYHYDPSIDPLDWDVFATISDSDGTPLSDDCDTAPGVSCNDFEYTSTVSVTPKALVGDPDPTATWNGVVVTDEDIATDVIPSITLYNRGNIDIVTAGPSPLDLNARNLICQNGGCVPATDNIPSERFSASGNAGDLAPVDGVIDQCGHDSAPPSANLMNVDGAGPVLDILGINLLYGDGTGSNDQDDLNLCIHTTLSDLGLDDPVGYSTVGGTAWDVTA